MLDPAEAEAQQTALDMQRAALNQNQTQLDDAEAVLNEQDAALTAQEAQLTETGKQLDEAETALSQMRTLLDIGQNDYTDGIAQLEYQRKTQTAKLDEAYNSLITFQNSIKEYNEGLASYNDGVKELADGKAEYEDGLKDYEDGKKEFDEQISDAEQKIADAKQELADLKKPELYVLTRDTNAGYVSFESDSTIVEKLSGLFPIFFFLIAALVCSTTMTRMIDDERTQIGTLRALGYSRGSISANICSIPAAPPHSAVSSAILRAAMFSRSSSGRPTACCIAFRVSSYCMTPCCLSSRLRRRFYARRAPHI